MLRSFAFLVLGLLLLRPAEALVFSTEQKENHLDQLPQIVLVASRCLQDTWDEHLAFYNKWGVSKFYGDRNPNLNTRQKRIQALQAAGAPIDLVDQLQGTSCIGMTLQCLEKGFASTKDSLSEQTWQTIQNYVKQHQLSGMHLVEALQALGWKTLYWNPDPSKNQEWDEEDPLLLTGRPVSWASGVVNSSGQWIYHPGWGLHRYRYMMVQQRGIYYTTPVDDDQLLVGFQTKVPLAFQMVPLFVGVAHAGYHVFPGYLGRVIEAHSTRALSSVDNLELSPFNPLHPNGGPRWSRSEKYRSGIVAVPPTQ